MRHPHPRKRRLKEADALKNRKLLLKTELFKAKQDPWFLYLVEYHFIYDTLDNRWLGAIERHYRDYSFRQVFESLKEKDQEILIWHLDIFK